VLLQILTYALVIVTNLTVGGLLLQRGRRNRALPELLLGASLTLDGLEWLFWVLAVETPAMGTPLGDFLATACRVGVAGHNICLLLFTWYVFRRDSRAALGVVVFVSLVAVVSLVVGVALGDWMGYRSDRIWIWLEVGALHVAYGWTFAESTLHYARMRRRLAHGLANPVVTNRLLLWAVYGCGSLGSQLAYTTSIGVATPEGVYPFFLDALMSLSSCFAAVALWLAFFPPQTYRNWLASGAPESAS
jgi:hypothetical protein